MRKILGLFVAAVVAGVALLSGAAAPASAAPSNSGVKWTSVQKAAPSTALTKSKSCSANDGGYKVIVTADYVVVAGKVDINKLNSVYYHRVALNWTVSDWASSSTDDLVNAGNLYSTITRNPGAKNDWFTASPAFTPNGLKIGVRKASGSGTALPAAGCFVALP